MLHCFWTHLKFAFNIFCPLDATWGIGYCNFVHKTIDEKELIKKIILITMIFFFWLWSESIMRPIQLFLREITTLDLWKALDPIHKRGLTSKILSRILKDIQQWNDCLSIVVFFVSFSLAHPPNKHETQAGSTSWSEAASIIKSLSFLLEGYTPTELPIGGLNTMKMARFFWSGLGCDRSLLVVIFTSHMPIGNNQYEFEIANRDFLLDYSACAGLSCSWIDSDGIALEKIWSCLIQTWFSCTLSASKNTS